MKTKHAPFSLYKKNVGTRQFWYVRFWDEKARAYNTHRATGIAVGSKKERRSEAEKAALDLLPTICFNAQYMNVVQYLKAFWKTDSRYFKESALVQKRPLSAYYAAAAQTLIRLHIEPFKPFNTMGITDITAGHLRDFMLWEAERKVSGNRINRAMQVIRVPLRDAIGRDEAKVDPFSKIKLAASQYKEKGVLTLDEIKSILGLSSVAPQKRLAVLLGLFCGMRLGEVRGLHWEDIKDDVISIRHNWQDMEGIKVPKFDSNRDASINKYLAAAIAAYRKERGGPKTGLVFSREKDGKPLCNGFFRIALSDTLTEAGIPGVWHSRKPKPEGYRNIQADRNITFHSLRHTFVSHSRLAGINDFQIQALAGHKSAAMMDRYSHPEQVVNLSECRDVLEKYVGGSQQLFFSSFFENSPKKA